MSHHNEGYHQTAHWGTQSATHQIVPPRYHLTDSTPSIPTSQITTNNVSVILTLFTTTNGLGINNASGSKLNPKPAENKIVLTLSL